MTKSSLLIPATVRPAPADRIAALEAKVLPGNESRRDWAFFSGASWGTPAEAYREEMDGMARKGTVGRRSCRAPVEGQYLGQWHQMQCLLEATYQQRSVRVAMPLFR